ncbi:MAG: DUF4302 domain-containing protein [Chitinophagaceae bacterium]|nr:DUF4302 domain-containing protein [Chitinophagaceae bacterium]
MKRVIIFTFAVMVVGAGCKKTYDDTVGGKTADQRISEALATYQKILMGAPYGWIFVESTTGIAYNQGVSQTGPKIVLGYYMQFVDSSKVTMISDFDTSMTTVPKTSGYRVKALTRPALIFDTYSYLHVPCEPNDAVSKSPFGPGYGWGTDFEYSFSDSRVPAVTADTLRLTGNLNSAGGLLVKATQAQRDAYLQGKTKGNMVGLGNLNNILNYFKRLTVGSVSYDLRVDVVNRTITFTWKDGSGNFQTQTVNYYVSGTGINLFTPIVNGSQTITSIDNITWNGSFTLFTVTINGQQGQVVGATTPVIADAGAPARWWNYANDNRLYWASWNGFHVNGVDDAFGVTTLSNASGTFYYYGYLPHLFGPPNNPDADAFAPLMLKKDSLSLNNYFTAPGFPPSFTGGKVIFTELGTIGTTPPGGPVDLSQQTLYNPAGFYLVQTGDKTYDMVLATDAKTWISWFFPR